MNYTVEWIHQAQSDLATVWLAAADRNAVSAASARLDAALADRPLELGESRQSSVSRMTFDEPLGIEFEVTEDDKRVIVQAVWAAG